MSRWGDNHTVCNKDRIRAEIKQQVKAYLQGGGVIDVISDNHGGQRGRGSVWWQLQEELGLGTEGGNT